MTRIAAFFTIEASWELTTVRKTRKCELEWLMCGWKLIKQDEKEAYEKALRENENKAGKPMGSAGKVVKEIDLMDMLRRNKTAKKPETIKEYQEQMRAKLPSQEKLAEMRADQKRRWGIK